MILLPLLQRALRKSSVHGHVNLDFADVNTTLKDGGVAIMVVEKEQEVTVLMRL